MSMTFGRIEKLGFAPDKGDHHPWASRDYEHVDCKATGCMFNRGETCMVPSRCRINAQGSCEGFQAPPPVTKVDGD